MGLDMYLEAEAYVPGFLHNTERTAYVSILASIGLKPEQMATDSPIVRVRANVGYWRKAYQIHNWFVTNVQGGKDECQRSDVSREQLTTLRDLCKQSLASRNAIREPRSGFFFGSTKVDKWYWDDIEKTVGILDRALAMPERWDFFYRASW